MYSTMRNTVRNNQINTCANCVRLIFVLLLDEGSWFLSMAAFRGSRSRHLFVPWPVCCAWSLSVAFSGAFLHLSFSPLPQTSLSVSYICLLRTILV